jgi:hypothetical protein
MLIHLQAKRVLFFSGTDPRFDSYAQQAEAVNGKQRQLA